MKIDDYVYFDSEFRELDLLEISSMTPLKDLFSYILVRGVYGRERHLKLRERREWDSDRSRNSHSEFPELSRPSRIPEFLQAIPLISIEFSLGQIRAVCSQSQHEPSQDPILGLLDPLAGMARGGDCRKFCIEILYECIEGVSGLPGQCHQTSHRSILSTTHKST